jgi:splicing factor 45
VDPELKNEMEEECSNYGKVEQCIIFEDTNYETPRDEAVRIFVKFASDEHTQKGRCLQ